MVIFNSYSTLVFGTLLVLSLSAMAGNNPPETADSSLEVIQQSRHSEILAAADVDWSIYSKIQLDRATVSFRENWVRDQRRDSGNIIRERDEQRFKSDLVDLLDEVFTSELSVKGGYVITDESDEDVLRFTPRIVNLDIVAPDRVRDHIGYALTDSQGSMTIELEIYDSVSGELLATTRQYQEDPHKGYMERTNSVTNKRAARLMLERWSTWLREWLDEARNGSD